MNPWLIASVAMMLCLVPCGIVCLRGDPATRLVGLETGALVVTLLLLVIAELLHRPPFTDLALTLALLSFGGGLVFARFLERWL